MDFEGLKNYVFEILEKGLSSDLIYHDISHTRDIVLPADEKLCEFVKIAVDDKNLVLSAAVQHD